MKRFLCVVVVGAMTALATAALAQTAKPPAKPAPAAKPVAAVAATKPIQAAAPRRNAVFVPPPPVIELDEIAPPADLPRVLSNDDRDRYRRIFQDQAAGHWAQADAEIAKLGDKTLMGYVGAQRLLAKNYTAKFPELASWLQEYNDHPDAPAIYKLAMARRTPGSGAVSYTHLTLPTIYSV